MLALGLVGLASALVPAGSAAAAAHSAPQTRAAASSLLKMNAVKRTVTFTLVAGDGTANGGLDFDSIYGGNMTLTVPVNWTVDVVFKNVGGLPHSVLFDA